MNTSITHTAPSRFCERICSLSLPPSPPTTHTNNDNNNNNNNNNNQHHNNSTGVWWSGAVWGQIWHVIALPSKNILDHSNLQFLEGIDSNNLIHGLAQNGEAGEYFVCLSYGGVRFIRHVTPYSAMLSALRRNSIEQIAEVLSNCGAGWGSALCIQTISQFYQRSQNPDASLVHAALAALSRVADVVDEEGELSALHWGMHGSVGSGLSSVLGRPICAIALDPVLLSPSLLHPTVSQGSAVLVAEKMFHLSNVLQLLAEQKFSDFNSTTQPESATSHEIQNIRQLIEFSTISSQLLRLLCLVHSHAIFSSLPVESDNHKKNVFVVGCETIDLAELRDALLEMKFEDLCSTQKGIRILQKIALLVVYNSDSEVLSRTTLGDEVSRLCPLLFGRAQNLLLRARTLFVLHRQNAAENHEEVCQRVFELVTDAQVVELMVSNLLEIIELKNITPFEAANSFDHVLKEICKQFELIGGYQFAVNLALHVSEVFEVEVDKLSDGLESSIGVSSMFSARTSLTAIQDSAPKRECFECACEALLYPVEQIDQGQNEIIELVKSSIMPLHPQFVLFLLDRLLENGQSDILLRLPSEVVDPFLREHGRFDLLWQHFLYWDCVDQAAKVLCYLAESEGPPENGSFFGWPQNLAARTMYLRYAVTYLCDWRGQVDKNFLHELTRKLQAAELQLRVQNELTSRGVLDGTSQSVLEHHLLKLEDLYKRFAKPHNLHVECVLLLWRMGATTHQTDFERLWKAIVHDTCNQPEWRQIFHQRLLEWMSLFPSDHPVFPLGFIVEEVLQWEMQDWARTINTGHFANQFRWLSHCLVQGGKSLPQVWALFENIFNQTQRRWSQDAFGVFVLIDLVCSFAPQLNDKLTSIRLRLTNLPANYEQIARHKLEELD